MKRIFIIFLTVSLCLLFSCNKKKSIINQKQAPADSIETVSKKNTLDSNKFIIKYLNDNDIGKTPYYVMKGESESPIIIVDGGIHGDEVAGYMACDTLLKYLKVTKGTVVLIPRLNSPACSALKRGLKNDFNRSFPGNKYSDDYEYRLANEFMNLIDSLKPEVVINHHEARNRFNRKDYEANPDKAFGQVLITCITPSEDLIQKALNNLNVKIKKPDYLYNIQYYPLQPNHSLDNIVSKLKIKSYTVETYRGYNLADRIKMHLFADFAFFEEIGIKYEFKNITIN